MKSYLEGKIMPITLAALILLVGLIVLYLLWQRGDFPQSVQQDTVENHQTSGCDWMLLPFGCI